MLQLCNSLLQSRHHWLWFSVFSPLFLSGFLKISFCWTWSPLPCSLPPSRAPSLLLYSGASCYQMLTAASWPMPLLVLQHWCSYKCFSLSFNSIQLDLSWTTFYWQDVRGWQVLLQPGRWLLNKEPLTMQRALCYFKEDMFFFTTAKLTNAHMAVISCSVLYLRVCMFLRSTWPVTLLWSASEAWVRQPQTKYKEQWPKNAQQPSDKKHYCHKCIWASKGHWNGQVCQGKNSQGMET